MKVFDGSEAFPGVLDPVFLVFFSALHSVRNPRSTFLKSLSWQESFKRIWLKSVTGSGVAALRAGRVLWFVAKLDAAPPGPLY